MKCKCGSTMTNHGAPIGWCCDRGFDCPVHIKNMAEIYANDTEVVTKEEVVIKKALQQARNKALEDAAKYLQSYARNMEEPMCEYTHTQNEAQKYILKRCAKAIRQLKEKE